MDIIKVDNKLNSPKYKQIVESIYDGICSGNLKKGDVLPSVNKTASKFSMARGSVFKAYDELKALGIIDSWSGKGYYIKNTTINVLQNIFLLFDSFAPYKEIIYNSFINNLQNKAKVDIYFYHHNIDVFGSLILQNISNYNTFVIVPQIHPKTQSILDQLLEKQLYILDMGYSEFGFKYPSVCQNFERDIFSNLQQLGNSLDKYQKIILVINKNHIAKGIISGFMKFCDFKKIAYDVLEEILDSEVKAGNCFIVINDNDLVDIIHKITQKSLELGKEIGIISYNETPLKSVIGNGITTISTDFALMGLTMSNMVIEHRTNQIENPCRLIMRQSF